MSVAEEYFAGMEKAPIFGAGQYVKGEGEFLLRSKAIKFNDGFSGKFFIAEYDVITSTSADDPAGGTRSWVVKLGDKNKNAFGDIKGMFFALVLGIDPNKAPSVEEDPALHAKAAEYVRAAVDPEYAKKHGYGLDEFVGLAVRLTTFFKPTRAGGKFTKHVWAPATPAAPAPAAAAVAPAA